MQKSKLQAELGFFKGLKEEISKILHEFDEFSKKHEFDFNFYSLEKGQRFIGKFMQVAKKLCEKYNLEYSKVNELLNFNPYKGLQYVSYPSKEENSNEWYSTLCAILLECDKAIEGLGTEVSELKSPIINYRKIKENFSNFLKFRPHFSGKKWFTMNNPLVWLIFSLILIIVSYLVYKILE